MITEPSTVIFIITPILWKPYTVYVQKTWNWNTLILFGMDLDINIIPPPILILPKLLLYRDLRYHASLRAIHISL